jgi:hypothetical protein
MKIKKLTKKQKLENHKQTKGYLKDQTKQKEKSEFNQKIKLWGKAVILRDNCFCQKCGKNLNELNIKGKPRRKHPHHIISLESVKEKYPGLLEDINNGVLLCYKCHKSSPDSAHQGGFEFVNWLKEEKYEQYEYLMSYLGYEHILNGKTKKRIEEEEKLKEINVQESLY